VADGTVYIWTSKGTVYALDASDGSRDWTAGTGTVTLSSPAVIDGTLYVGSDDGNVYALDAAEGTRRWAFETGDIVISSPAVVGGTVYVGSNDGKIYALTEAPRGTSSAQDRNEPPDADAGRDRAVEAGTVVTLDATDATDPDGDALVYEWTQTGGPDVDLSGGTTPWASFRAPDVDAETTLTFEVTVSDVDGGTDTDGVAVTVVPGDEVSVQLKGQRTDITVDQTAKLQMSAVNKIGNPPMTVQLILKTPSGTSVVETGAVSSSVGQATATFEVRPGSGKGISIQIEANQPMESEITGEIVYYFAENRTDTTTRPVSIPLHVRPEGAGEPTTRPPTAGNDGVPGMGVLTGAAAAAAGGLLRALRSDEG
jgi:hypothetical protein